ncbi:MAG: single-stranded DNA-binding protein [Clostridia bacterium]|nr:single-stranded DNA-binding protein [Clostridia bacterium]
MNKVTLMGRFTRDPEMRQSTQGTPVVSFTLAVDRRFARDGQQSADFISCVAWSRTAEFICKYFQKGSQIAVSGRLQSRTYDDKDGKRQYVTEVVVEETYFTGSRQDSQSQSAPGSYQRPASAPSQSTNFDEFEAMGFSSMDGSEDDLPF